MKDACESRDIAIALYAGGELTDAESKEIREHIGTCERCQALFNDLVADRATLRSHDVDEFAASAIRNRVMRTLRQRRAVRWVYAAASVLLVAGLSLAALVWQGRRNRPVTVARHEYPAHKPAGDLPSGVDRAPGTQVAAVVSSRHGRRGRVVRTQHPHRTTFGRRAEGEQQATLLVKLETDDPNVVIYWIAN